MVQVCFVSGCDHRGGRGTCHFYRFPRDKRKRWGELSRRTDRLPHTENDRICSCHFVGGDKTKDPVFFPYNKGECLNTPDPEVRFQRTVVKHCCIVGCEVESNDFSRALGISFYSFPSNKLQRQAWITTIGRTVDWKPSSCDRICSCHFAYGRTSNNPADLNYRPTLFLGSDDMARSHRSGATSSSVTVSPNQDVLCKPSTMMKVKVITAEVEERDENVCRRSQENLPSEAHIESNRIAENYSVQELARALHQFQQTGYLCDTLLVAEDGQLKAHSAVLAAASPLLKSSLKMISPISHVIILPGIKFFILEVIVHFIYTGDVVIPAKYSADKDVSTLILATMLELGLKVATSHSRNIPGIADSKDNRTVIIRGNTASTASLNVSNNSGNSLSPGKQTSSSIRQEQDLDFEHVNTTVPAATKPSSSTESIRRAGSPAQLPTHGVLNVPSRLSKQLQSTDQNLANTSDVKNTVKSALPYSSSRQYLTVVDSSGRLVVIESRGQKKVRKENCIPPGKQLCEYCGKLCQSHKMLVNHLTTHTGNLQFACKECDKRFAYELRLKQHMFTHTGQRTFTCQACHQVFTDVEKFREHKQIAHRGMRLGGAEKKRKECLVCGRTFSSNWNLNLHMRSHTGEKPFRCPMCPRKFVMKQGLQWHMRQHTGETPHLCQECGYSFSQPSSYYGHMMKHHGYKKKPQLSGGDNAPMVKNV